MLMKSASAMHIEHEAVCTVTVLSFLSHERVKIQRSKVAVESPVFFTYLLFFSPKNNKEVLRLNIHM